MKNRGDNRMTYNQWDSDDNKRGERHTPSQKYFINRLKYRFMLVFPVFGFLFGSGTLKSFEAEPMMFILILCVIGSLAEFIPADWGKASSDENENKIDWHGFIKTLVGYSVLFIVGFGIGNIFGVK